MNGLFLQGGGAKGAFQAGVICGLYERGFKFEVISGTSIGAINSYYIYTENIDKLRDTWFNLDVAMGTEDKDDKVIENDQLIDILANLEGLNKDIKSLYVNYIKIKNNFPNQKMVDLTKLNKDEQLKAIKHSSLLPCRVEEGESKQEILKKFDSEVIFDRFKEDLREGLYEGYNLDGGILNNNFLEPFKKEKVDKLYMITFKNNYIIPEYILDEYNKEVIQEVSLQLRSLPTGSWRTLRTISGEALDDKYTALFVNAGVGITPARLGTIPALPRFCAVR